ncbi:MAG: D-tyrosyl-tRNA(Tyr) deacylase [Deltaproteobacteria bacterium]|nr:MAG: D-tyrosyl-tRNA(Tyr) deacylase [Deltaproteobacteria bacterium]
MRGVVQRVSRAKVAIGGEEVGSINRGFLLLVGAEEGDTPDDVAYIVDKTAGLRVFEDGEGKMNLPLDEVDGAVLVVSQFTLLGDCRKGRRPSFIKSGPMDRAEDLYMSVVERLREKGLHVETGRFREEMEVELVNDGPVTILLDSRKMF